MNNNDLAKIRTKLANQRTYLAYMRTGFAIAAIAGSFKKKHLLDHHRKRFQIVEDDIEDIDIKILVFDDLIKKYNISEIEYLFIDTEGYDYKIIKSLNLNKIKINKVKFEYKHLDDTFKFEVRLLELREIFSQLNFRETEIDDENITFEKKDI